MSNDILNGFLNQIKQQVSRNESLAAVVTVNFEQNLQLVCNLQNYLLDHPIDIASVIEKFQFFKGNGNNEKLAFNQYIESYVTFVRDFNAYSIIESIDLILNYFNQLVVVFNNYDDLSSILVNAVVNDLQYIYKLSGTVDTVLYQQAISKNYPILSKLSIYLSKLFNNCKKNLMKSSVKKSLVLKVSNYLLRIYFKIGQPLNSNTIFISNRHNFKTLKGSNFGKKDLIIYRYYLGKYLLINNVYSHALTQFKYCYHNFSIRELQRGNTKLFGRILEYLVVSLSITGYQPTKTLILKFSIVLGNNTLASLYSQIAAYVKSGNLNAFCRLVEINKEHYRSRSLYNLLLKSMAPIIHRNLFYRVFKLYNNGNIRSNYKHVISYEEFVTALRIADSTAISSPAKTHEEELEHVEEILVSLINKHWIKGIVFSNSFKLSVSKKGDCFPPLTARQDGGRNEYDWLDK